MTRVAIVEDDDAIREALARWIDSTPDHRCVCACATAKAALTRIPRQRPDVVLMDIELPGESGISCLARLKKRCPTLPVVMLTAHAEREVICEALRAGASGYLLKSSSRDDILRAIAVVRAGGAPLSPEVAQGVVQLFQAGPALIDRSVNLSPRETDVLELLARGLANKQIAARLGISYETVCVHLRRIYEKLGVHSRTEAVIKYLERGPNPGGMTESIWPSRSPAMSEANGHTNGLSLQSVDTATHTARLIHP